MSFFCREYALIRIKAAFRENKSITDSAVIDNQVKEGYQNLDVIKRQVITVLTRESVGGMPRISLCPFLYSRF